MRNLYLISGGSRGLGAALVRHLAREEEVVISASRGAPPAGKHVRCDLSDPDIAVEAVALSLRQHVAHDIGAYILINNAGTLQPIGTQQTAAQIRQSLSVNLVAPIAITRTFVETLAEVDARKLVVNVSSGAALKPYHGWSLYCAAKAGLEHFARALALEQLSHPHPVDIVNVDPGIIDTDMQAEIRAAGKDQFPALERFKAYHADGKLAPAATVAARLVAGIRSGRKHQGATVGLDEFALYHPEV